MTDNEPIRLRDLLPNFTADRGGVDFRDTPEKRARREREDQEKRQAQARWSALHRQVRDAHGPGVLQQLIDMHSPEIRWADEAPDCTYCTAEDSYGESSPHWPCPEVRIIAGGVGVELPPADDD